MRRLLVALFLLLAVTMVAAPAQAFDARTVVNAVNQLRANQGLPSLRLSSTMQRAAQEQAAIMAKKRKMGHSVGFGNSFKRRLKRVGHRGAAAENVAVGQRNAQAVLRAWMGSRGHRRNILNRKMKTFGLAMKTGGGRNYWAMVLGQS
ncbi:MAG: CAP domain-containing protein [Pseudomonadota bacterium]